MAQPAELDEVVLVVDKKWLVTGELRRELLESLESCTVSADFECRRQAQKGPEQDHAKVLLSAFGLPSDAATRVPGAVFVTCSVQPAYMLSQRLLIIMQPCADSSVRRELCTGPSIRTQSTARVD